jgi:hypothetical protein
MWNDRRLSIPSVLAVAHGALLVCLTGRTAHAIDAPDDRDKARPCRPTITCTADIVAPGELEVEAGGAYARGDALEQVTLPFLLKLTLAPWIQWQVGSNGVTFARTDPHTTFLDNVFTGPKLHLVDQGSIVPSLALSAQVSIPTFAIDGYTRNTDLSFVGFASKDLGPLHVDWNIGLSVWGLNDGALTQGYTSLVLATSLPAGFGVEVEGYIFSDAAPASNHDGGPRAALTLSPRNWLVFDAGGDIGLYPSIRGYTIFAGATVIPAVFWRSGGGG